MKAKLHNIRVYSADNGYILEYMIKGDGKGPDVYDQHQILFLDKGNLIAKLASVIQELD